MGVLTKQLDLRHRSYQKSFGNFINIPQYIFHIFENYTKDMFSQNECIHEFLEDHVKEFNIR